MLLHHRPNMAMTSRAGLWPMLNVFVIVFVIILAVLIMVALGVTRAS